MMQEIPIMREFLAAYRHPKVRLFRRNILDKTVKDFYTARPFQAKAGIKGQADVYGFISSFRAVPLEIEFKGERTPTSDEQKNWKNFCDNWGIPHFTFRARVGETSPETVTRWTEELDSIVKSLSP